MAKHNSGVSQDTSSLAAEKQSIDTSPMALESQFIERLRRHRYQAQLQMQLVPVANLHNTNVANWQRLVPLRCENQSGCAFTWEQQAKSLVNTCHRWCSIVRDNWSCAGNQYERVLNGTPCFNSSLRFEHWPRGARVFAEGNSFLAQLFYTILCASHAHIWKLHTGNSLIAFSPSGASVFLLNNHAYWNRDTYRTVSLLKDIAFDPTVIVLGSLINRSVADEVQRTKTFSSEFNTSRLVKHFGRHLPTYCSADFTNCGYGKAGHTCIPGPINTNAEELVRLILNERLATLS